MDQSQRELFENNRITEAICQFSFKRPLNVEYIQAIVSQLLSKYPLKQDVPLMRFSINSNDITSIGAPVNGAKLTNDKKDKVLQVFSDNISIHQVGGYQTWEVFSEDIDYVLDIVKDLSNCEIGRIDLRTINVFEFDGVFDAKDYFHVALNYPADFIQQSNFQFALEQVYVPNKCAGVIRGNYLRDNNGLKFVLDLSYVNWLFDEIINTNDTVLIKKRLEDGHVKLYDLFIRAITKKTRDLIKRK